MSESVEQEYPKRSINVHDLGFLEQLQHELNTQPHLCQADPRFWVIRDYYYREAAENDEIDAVELFEDGEGETMSLEEAVMRAYKDELDFGGEDHAREWLEDNWLELDESGNVKGRYATISDITFRNVIENYAKHNMLDCVFLTKHWKIVADTMFLTLREAEDHLETNYYHYTNEARTYAMTAWRSPDVAQLIKLLHEVDFNELSELVSKAEKEREQ